MPADDGSSSSTELAAGFRLERRLGSSTWAAVQPELGRRVALRRLAPGVRFRADRWPKAAGIVDLLAVTQSPEGTYVATRLVDGARTLAEIRNGRKVTRALAEAAATLERTGAVHGHLTASDILVAGDGRVLLTGFGRAAGGARAEDDRAALLALQPTRRRRPAALIVAAVATTAAVAAVIVTDNAPDRPDPARPAPPVATGALAIGSPLAPAGVTTVDCSGNAPGGASLPCTLMQTRLPGRALAAPSAGVVRAWSVRGVRGRVALQVIRRTGRRFFVSNSSRVVTVTDPDVPRVVRAGLTVPAGARFALEVLPGAGVGLRRGVAGAGAVRFSSPLRVNPRSPDPGGAQVGELLLRVDFVPART